MTKALPAILIILSPALGWWSGGHDILTRSALLTLRESSLPKFFVRGAPLIAHCAIDPDVTRNPATPQIGAAGSPEHFIDIELLKGQPLPLDRWAFVAACAKVGVDPRKVGFLPYAVIEHTERLAIAFAEYRKWPTNTLIQQKCLVYAGLLAHFAEDLCQPLHVTVHYDGRVGEDGKNPRTGIHGRVDGLIENLKMRPDSLAAGQAPHAIGDLVAGVLDRTRRSGNLVDTIYSLPGLATPGPLDSATIERAGNLAREAVGFTSVLYLTAWEISGKVALGDELDRARLDGASAK